MMSRVSRMEGEKSNTIIITFDEIIGWTKITIGERVCFRFTTNLLST